MGCSLTSLWFILYFFLSLSSILITNILCIHIFLYTFFYSSIFRWVKSYTLRKIYIKDDNIMKRRSRFIYITKTDMMMMLFMILYFNFFKKKYVLRFKLCAHNLFQSYSSLTMCRESLWVLFLRFDSRGILGFFCRFTVFDESSRNVNGCSDFFWRNLWSFFEFWHWKFKILKHKNILVDLLFVFWASSYG